MLQSCSAGDARGALPDRHPLAFTSPLRGYGDPETETLLREADVILVVGGRFARVEGDRWDRDEGQKLVCVDIDPTRLAAADGPAVAIEADARVAMAAIAEALEGMAISSDWDRQKLAWVHDARKSRLRKNHPAQMKVMDEVRAVLPDETIIVGGVTVGSRWMGSALEIVKPRTLLSSSYMTTLGYAFPAGLGAKVGNPDTPVIALSGDGGFMYAVGDLATAVQHHINLVTLVFNNGEIRLLPAGPDRLQVRGPRHRH